KMAITYNGGNQPATLVDVATATEAPSVASWNFATFTPDGTEFISVEGGQLTLRSATDQSAIMTVPSGVTYATQPDISADGQHLVFVSPQDYGADYSFGRGSIVTMSFDQTTHTFGAGHVIVNFDPTYNYY